MRKLLSVITVFISLCVMMGCGPSQAENAEQQRADSLRAIDSLRALDSLRIADSLKVADSIRIADSIRVADSIANAQKEQEAIAFITDMYNNHKYEDYGYLRKNCTAKMLKFLRDNYDYDCEDGNCLAVWMFRSDNQDGVNEKYGVITVIPQGDDWYQYTFYDMGYKAARTIKVINDNGKMMIDGLKK